MSAATVDALAGIRCYFRDPMLKKAFCEAVTAYRNSSPAFFHNGQPAATNSAATMFWRGFNDTKCAFREHRGDGTFAYAYWKAGKAVRAALARIGGAP